MANDRGDERQTSADASDERQTEPRQGLPGKGYDAGGGYGGAGNDSLYSAESSYGGQSGRAGEQDIEIPRGTDESTDIDIEADTPLGGERREPGR